MDLAKYRALFLEEATEHLAEMSRALLALEKDAARHGGDRPRLPHGALHQGHGGVARLRRDRPSSRTGSRICSRASAARAPWTRTRASLLFRGARGARAHGRGRARNGRGAGRRRDADRRAVGGAADAFRGRTKKSLSAAAAVSDAAPAEPAAPAPPVSGTAPAPTLRVRAETLDRFLSSVGEVVLTSSQLRAHGAA